MLDNLTCAFSLSIFYNDAPQESGPTSDVPPFGITMTHVVIKSV